MKKISTPSKKNQDTYGTGSQKGAKPMSAEDAFFEHHSFTGPGKNTMYNIMSYARALSVMKTEIAGDFNLILN